jgi:hypothetical protein
MNHSTIKITMLLVLLVTTLLSTTTLPPTNTKTLYGNNNHKPFIMTILITTVTSFVIFPNNNKVEAVLTSAPVHQTFTPTRKPTLLPISKSPTKPPSRIPRSTHSPTKFPTVAKCGLCETGKICAKFLKKLQQKQSYCDMLVNERKCTDVMWMDKGCPTRCQVRGKI